MCCHQLIRQVNWTYHIGPRKSRQLIDDLIRKGFTHEKVAGKLTNAAQVTLAIAAALVLLTSQLGQSLACNVLGHGVVVLALGEAERAFDSMGVREVIRVATGVVAQAIDGVGRRNGVPGARLVHHTHGVLIGEQVARDSQRAPARKVGRPGEVGVAGGTRGVCDGRSSGWDAGDAADESVHQQSQRGREDELKKHHEVSVYRLIGLKVCWVLFFVGEVRKESGFLAGKEGEMGGIHRCRSSPFPTRTEVGVQRNGSLYWVTPKAINHSSNEECSHTPLKRALNV